MTWREGVEYWRAWARRDDGDIWARLDDGDIIEDARRIAAFYEAIARCNPPSLDDPMPLKLSKELGMETA